MVHPLDVPGLLIIPESFPPKDVEALIDSQLALLKGAAVADPTEVNAQITDAVAQANPDLMQHAGAVVARIDQSLAKVGEWLEAGETLVIEQAPLLVQEVLWWGVAEAGFVVSLGIIFMLCNPLVVRYLGKSDELAERTSKIGGALAEHGEPGSFAMALFGAIIIPIIGFIIAASHIMGVLKPLLAPRLYLIEYFKNLVQ